MDMNDPVSKRPFAPIRTTIKQKVSNPGNADKFCSTFWPNN